MLDRRMFLATIREHPTDDAPKLVFADWLEEQGEVYEAELIRIECQLRRTPQEICRSISGTEVRVGRMNPQFYELCLKANAVGKLISARRANGNGC